MAKVKTTRKSIRENYSNIICVGYCNLQHLLAFEREQYYCTRVEGWACDIYTFNDKDTAIVTGYAPFGNIRPSYDLQKEYDKAAEKIQYDYSIEWEERERLIRNMINDFIGDCLTEKTKIGG